MVAYCNNLEKNLQFKMSQRIKFYVANFQQLIKLMIMKHHGIILKTKIMLFLQIAK